MIPCCCSHSCVCVCCARAFVHAAAGGSKAAKAAAKSAAKQDKRNAKLKEQRAAEAAAGPKKRSNDLQVRGRGPRLTTVVIAATLLLSTQAQRERQTLAVRLPPYGTPCPCPLSRCTFICNSMSLFLLLHSTQTETEQFNKAIKGVKSRARSLMQQGMTAKVAQKMAQKEVTGEWLVAEVV